MLSAGIRVSLFSSPVRRAFVLFSATAALLVAAPAAQADTVGPIDFESPGYTVGNINGQNGWLKTGGFDVAVASVASYVDASGYGFGAQALRSSDAVTSGSFGDQTFSPGLSSSAGESGLSHFDSTFKIGTTKSTLQTDLHMSVSPDDGNGARMSYLRFEDLAGGVHVFFDDVTDPGPLGTVATFNETDIAILSRSSSHTIRFSIDFLPGPANDVVRIYVDGALKITGTTWEDYYRYDPEQAGGGNVVPSTSKMLFRESGTANAGNSGQGFLIDGLSLQSSSGAPALTVNDDTTGPGPAGATCATPDYSTIPAAVAGSVPGQTILVCAGSYPQTVNITKSNLTIRGAQAGVDARTRGVPVSSESVVTGGGIGVVANGVTLDGSPSRASRRPRSGSVSTWPGRTRASGSSTTSSRTTSSASTSTALGRARRPSGTTCSRTTTSRVLPAATASTPMRGPTTWSSARTSSSATRTPTSCSPKHRPQRASATSTFRAMR